MVAQQSFDHRLLRGCKKRLLMECNTVHITDKLCLCFRVLRTWLCSQAWQLSLSSEEMVWISWNAVLCKGLLVV